MSGSARKRRVALLASFAVIILVLYTFGSESETLSGRSTIWQSQTEPELGQRIRESQEHSAIPQTPDHKFLDGETNVGVTTAIQPTIGKVTISFGEADEVYERAIRSHELHNRLMGYSQFVLRERLVPGLWSKHAYIFSIIVQELSKPEPQRLKWLM